MECFLKLDIVQNKEQRTTRAINYTYCRSKVTAIEFIKMQYNVGITEQANVFVILEQTPGIRSKLSM